MGLIEHVISVGRFKYNLLYQTAATVRQIMRILLGSRLSGACSSDPTPPPLNVAYVCACVFLLCVFICACVQVVCD